MNIYNKHKHNHRIYKLYLKLTNTISAKSKNIELLISELDELEIIQYWILIGKYNHGIPFDKRIWTTSGIIKSGTSWIATHKIALSCRLY